MPPQLELDCVSKSYGKQVVLHGVSIRIEQGELVVVLGESGSGKSTLLRLIAGLEACSSGAVLLQGVDQKNVPPHQRSIGIVFQNGNGYEHISVRENLELAFMASKNPSGDKRSEVNRWIELVQIGSLVSQKLCLLSVGQQQRVALARAYLSGKSLLLMDEPLASLDYIHRSELRELIRNEHRGRGQTLVYVTHDSDEAMLLADRIVLLSQGQVIQAGGPQDIYLRPVSLLAGKRLGRHLMNEIELPIAWFENSGRQGLEGRTVRCGVRPEDWTLVSIAFGREADLLPGAPADFVAGLNGNFVILQQPDGGRLVKACGRISKASWLGDSWLVRRESNRGGLELSVSAGALSVDLSNQLDSVGSKDLSSSVGDVFAVVTIPIARLSPFLQMGGGFKSCLGESQS
jgi:ABC-type sugar transport system ATPase subunit